MQPKYLITIITGLFVIVGWNVFLIQRDNKMFEGYETNGKQIQINPSTNAN
jgi:hypothetical protein